MSRVIGVISGKGGVGKTTIVANLGAALRNVFGRNVIILDANTNTSHLGLHFGIYDDPRITLREVFNRNSPLSQAIYNHPTLGIDILPSSLSGEGVRISPQKLKRVVKNLKQNYEIIIMDCSPGLGKDAAVSILNMDSAIIVTTPDFPAVADALKTVQVLERAGKSIIGIVVNKHRGKSYELKINEIESTCGVRVIAIIPDDRRVQEAVAEGVPAVLYSPNNKASIAIKKLAGSLVGQEYDSGTFIDKIVRLFSQPKVQYGHEVRMTGIETEAADAKLPEITPKEMDVMSQDVKDEIRKELKSKILKRVRRRLRD